MVEMVEKHQQKKKLLVYIKIVTTNKRYYRVKSVNLMLRKN